MYEEYVSFLIFLLFFFSPSAGAAPEPAALEEGVFLPATGVFEATEGAFPAVEAGLGAIAI